MAVGVETVETTHHILATVPLMLFQAIAISHLKYSA